MKDDVRYCEFLFLRDVEKNPLSWFNANDQKQQQNLGLNQVMLIEMVLFLLEDLCIHPNQDVVQRLVYQMRGETGRNAGIARAELFNLFVGQLYQFRITYRGLRRIDELRELLKRDRILDDFGILLSIRYMRKDVEAALQHASDVSVSMLCLDMDDFGIINKQSGYAAGNVVMEAYLKTVQESVGDFGTGFRGVGDEVFVLIVGQGHEKAMEIAETIKHGVAALRCQYKEKLLPPVTVSIGVATTPPESHSMDIQTLADARQQTAKANGKNRVIGT